jgi:diacylglycerol O-acyltransferase
MMPTMGNLTLVVGVLSYEGQLNFTAAADRDGCPDVDVFARGVSSGSASAGGPRQARRAAAAPSSTPGLFP